MAEPNPNRAPVRKSTVGRPHIAAELRHIRAIMSMQTEQLVELLAVRCDFAVGAVDFKETEDEVRAPAQQAKNIERAVEFARILHPEWTAFHRFIERVMTVVVVESVAMQLEEFRYTEPIDSPLTTKQLDT